MSRSVDNPLLSNDINVNGTLNVLVAARDCGVKRVVYASSSSVYGDTPTLPKVESMKPDPKSPYAVSKLVGEYYMKVFYEVYGLETVSLRYFNVFGSRQNPDSEYAAVIPRFIKSMLAGKQPIVFGDGTQTRDFSYIKDVVAANILAMNSSKIVGRVFNIAYGVQTDLNELVKKLNAIIGCQVEPSYSEPRAGDVKHSLADISEIRESIGFKPEYDLEKGLVETVEWYKNGC